MSTNLPSPVPPAFVAVMVTLLVAAVVGVPLGPTTPNPCPVNDISWYQAAEFCNRLSHRDGIIDAQWSYLPKDNKFASGMTIVPVAQKRIGYRLPTLFEYDLAIRGGSSSTYSFGEADMLVEKHAWHNLNSNSKCHPTAELRPNLFGLFDAHGNISIWCQGHPKQIQRDENGVFVEDGDVLYVKDGDSKGANNDLSKWRPVRGSAFHGVFANMKSSESNLRLPSGFVGDSDQRQSIGLRVIRTISR